MVQWLNGLPEVRAVLAAEFQGKPIRKQNLSRWRKGGFNEAVKEDNTRREVQSFLKEIDGLKGAAKENLTDQLAFYLAVRAALQVIRLKSAPPILAKRFSAVAINPVVWRNFAARPTF